MPSLHLVFNEAGYDACLAVRAEDDTVVLLADGVYIQPTDSDMYALEADCTLRQVTPDCTLLSLTDLVELTTQHTPIVSWSR